VSGGAEPIAIVILAAGASRRMGVAKQLLQVRGRSLFRHVADAALGSSCRPVIAVLGGNAEAVQPEVEGLPVQIVWNAHWSEGLSTSTHSAPGRPHDVRITAPPPPPHHFRLALLAQVYLLARGRRAIRSSPRSDRFKSRALCLVGVAIGALFLLNGRPEEIQAILRQHGISLLNNSHRMIHTKEGPVVIAGIDDLRAGEPDLDAAIRGRVPAIPTLLLSHLPEITVFHLT
jgi:hypothetical protein